MQKRLGQLSDRFLRYGLHKSLRLFCVYFCFDKFFEKRNNTKTSNAIEFHLQHDKKKEDLPLKEQIPETYHEYLKIFDENEADRFPESRPWDHKIELKEGFQPKSFKSYNLTPEEQTELDKFLKENLEKGYIRPSQSPMATPFFFVKKKDGKL